MKADKITLKRVNFKGYTQGFKVYFSNNLQTIKYPRKKGYFYTAFSSLASLELAQGEFKRDGNYI